MSFGIVVDSSCDISQEEAKELGIVIAPLTITLDGKEHKDGVELTAEEYVDAMCASDNLPKTTQVTPVEFAEFYQKLADEGCEEIISIHIAGTLSGTVGSASIAARDASVPVHVVDSHVVASSLGLLVRYATELRDQGMNASEAVSLLEKARSQARFVIAPDTLEYLLKGGRLSEEEAIAAGKLNIKPIITLNDDGTLKTVDKKRGMKNAVKGYVDQIESLTEEFGKLRITFIHTGDNEHIDLLKTLLAERGIEYVDEGIAVCGATVSTHLGPGCVGFTSLPVRIS